MKATGIVRRIDDLGRVVVPKEIRRTLRIREGDPMEIFTDREGEIILKKYSPIGEIGHFSQQYAEAVYQATKHTVIVSDKDQIIAVAGIPKRELIGSSIHHELEHTMEDRQNILACQKDKEFIKISSVLSHDFTSQAIATIICEGDAIGSVMILSARDDNPVTNAELTLAVTGANFIGKQLEN